MDNLEILAAQNLVAVNKYFVEESGPKRALWDKGCADWPQEILEGFTGVRRNPEINSRKSDGNFQVLSKMVIKPERGEKIDDVLKSLDRLMGSGKLYEKWVMPGINENPSGGTYFVNVVSLTAREIIPLERYVLSGPYKFKVLWFEREGISSIEFRRDFEAMPSCDPFKAAENKAAAAKFVFRMTPREDLLELMMGEVWLAKINNQIEMRMRLIARPAKIVYELMPDSVLRNQLHSRGRRIFENFLEFRRTERAALLSNPVSGQPRKAAGNRASER